MKFGLLKAFALGCVLLLAVTLNACDGDSATFSPTEKLPTEVKNLKELEELKCDMSIIGEKVSVESENYLYECDGEIWFKSYDQTELNSTSTKSSSSTKAAYSPCLNTNVSYGKVTDSRDGLVYRTVTIGTQTWMAENLNYAAYLDVPVYWTEKEKFYSSDSSSWCYDNDPANCEKYGRLYTWAVAMDSAAQFSTTGKGYGLNGLDLDSPSEFVRGICPGGWHLPSSEEWNRLFVAVGSRPEKFVSHLRVRNVGPKFKSACGWDDGNGTDEYGFSIYPAGIGRFDNFQFFGEKARFWSSTKYPYVDAVSWEFENLSEDVNEFPSYMYFGLSVRCVEDEVKLPKKLPPCGGKKSSWTYLNPNIDYGCMTDNRDGQVYATVSIGSQIWMAENLNYEPRYGWSACYNNTARYCDVYGRLYSFAAAMDSVNQGGCGFDGDCTPNIPHRGICPDGWHIPTKTECDTLLSTVGIDDSTRSVELRSKAWMLGLDDYGFSAAPSGQAYICGEEETFLSIDGQVDFWSVEGSLYITDYSARWTNGNGRCYPRSVRCIKD
jgi:uncharacterized protein (TIGR02145 family)